MESAKKAGQDQIFEEKAKAVWDRIKSESDELYKKIDEGTATPEEVEQYNYKMLPYEEMDPAVLYADMPHAEFIKMMREKHAKRIAEEANVQKPEK